MENRKGKPIGKYYIQLKDVHINWTHRTGPKREGEAYLPIPAKYAYAFNILKGNLYSCTYVGSDTTVVLRAAGTQSRRDYAKQFQGSENLRILYDWYKSWGAVEGDYVIVSIWSEKRLALDYVKQTQAENIKRYNLVGANGKPSEETEKVEANRVGFRLVSLIVKDKDEVICDYNFLDDKLKTPSTEPITTLIIGANGTGKSFAMKILSEIFLATQNNNINKLLSHDYYCLKYILDENIIEIEITNRTILIHNNGVLVDKPDTSTLPQKVLAIAFMLNDKFAFKADDGNGESVYEYLGMRMTSNAAWISSFSNKVAENLIDLAADGKLWKLIQDLSVYLEIDPKISIACELQETKYTFEELLALSNHELAQHLMETGEKIQQSEDYRRGSIKRLTDDDYKELAVFLYGLKELDPFVPDMAQKCFGYIFNAETELTDMQDIQSDYKRLQKLKSLRIIKNITLSIYKKGNRYSFDDSSSGEKHILYSVLNIARCLKKNSLVLIDEPEISLHPNWQMFYISLLKRLFKEYSSCHFIIASHSPYLISDLTPDNSTLITLNIENGRHTAKTIDYSTYAWSAENILYNVFHVRTTRNFYFDLDLRELLSKTADGKSEDLPRVKELFQKLSSYVFDNSDPLKKILEEVEVYIENAESK